MLFGISEKLHALDSCCKRSHKRIDEIEDVRTDLVVELKLIRKEIEGHKNNFENHDESEMEKYDAIKDSIVKLNQEIHKFNKILWVTIGIVAVLNFLGITDSVKHIIREGVSQNYKIGDRK